MTKEIRNKFIPLFMGGAIIAADQISKALIVKTSGGKEGLISTHLGNLLWITHQRNTGAAFSFLAGMGPVLRFVFLAIVPLLALVAIMVYYFRSRELTGFQRWALAAAVSGGLGNLIDRFFRFPAGVVDFLSVRFPGPWGDRWPTFNVADSALTIGCSLIILSTLIQALRERKSSGTDAQAGSGA